MAIKSRPLYSGFVFDHFAQLHLFVLEGDGALALLEKLSTGQQLMATATILHLPAGKDHGSALKKLGAREYLMIANLEDLNKKLAEILQQASMSTRIYVAGSEGFIGTVVCLGESLGIKNASVVKEHRGSFKRRVQCVHCKGFNEDITMSHFRCTHCDLYLYVRDHFSVRLNAFQGVCANAEEPGVLPEVQEIFK